MTKVKQFTHQCYGDEICCGKFKSVNNFSPSALKRICKYCTKLIRE
jgi:hypothetical protein